MAFARQGATVVVVARDPTKGETAMRNIRRVTGDGTVELLLADLASLESIRDLARSFRRRHDRLDVLVHTAAIFTRQRETTPDGLERMFATNYLGPFLLTNLLRPALQAGSPSRVIVVSAPSTTKLDFDDLQGVKQFGALHAFGASKAADLLFTYELARRLAGTGATANVPYPGLMKSDLMRELGAPMRGLIRLVSKSPEQAAEAALHLATATSLAGVTSQFFKGTKPSASSAYSRNPDVQRQLWAESERLVGQTFP